MKKFLTGVLLAGFLALSFAQAFAACGNLVASKSGDKYHNVACGIAKNIKVENQVCFNYPEEASAKGYTPCGVCKPIEHTKVVGSKASDKYHLPTCGIVKNIKPENILSFNSPEDAAKAGLTSPCGVCKPPAVPRSGSRSSG